MPRPTADEYPVDAVFFEVSVDPYVLAQHIVDLEKSLDTTHNIIIGMSKDIIAKNGEIQKLKVKLEKYEPYNYA